jgi:hypothetical protein
MQWYWLIVGVLGVWRLNHGLVSEAGPWGVLERLRRRLVRNVAGSLVNCFYCSSVWTAAPFSIALNDTWKGRLLLWPALSAGSIIIEKILYPDTFAMTPDYLEDPENPDVLRQGQDGDSLHHP